MPRCLPVAIKMILLAAVLAVVWPIALQAHHGWAWATDEAFSIAGRITDVRLGKPHGELTRDVDGEAWTVEVGQPWRNERAGLTRELLSVARMITVHGHRAADPQRKLVKAERVEIEGKRYALYPGRSS